MSTGFEAVVPMTTPAVFLACPMRPDGRAMFGSQVAVHRASEDGLEVTPAYAHTSILPLTFNCLWAAALNKYEAGEVTHFAMIHDDILAPVGWLDVMIREQTRFGLDVLSAVAPIKDARGLTSTAIETACEWNPRRLTLRELHAKAEETGRKTVFGADFGGPILVNTGLWVCKLGPWAKSVAFRQQDRIVFKDGEYQAETKSEDWDFTRQVRAATGRDAIAATLVVPLVHERPEWTSRKPWGTWATDELHLPKPEPVAA